MISFFKNKSKNSNERKEQFFMKAPQNFLYTNSDRYTHSPRSLTLKKKKNAAYMTSQIEIIKRQLQMIFD
jgi:hypothetical protein